MHPIILHENHLTKEVIKQKNIGDKLGDDDLNEALQTVSDSFPALARRVGARLCMMTSPADQDDGDASQGED